MRFLVLGALTHANPPIGREGVAWVIDWERRTILHETHYVSPPDRVGDERCKRNLTTGTVANGRVYVCTSTEAVVMEDPSRPRVVHTFSHPSFNDLHHIIPYRDGYAVANTGLELIQFFDAAGRLTDSIDVLETIGATRERRADLDYRMIPDTKPHLVHPNHLQEHEGRLWCTRFMQKDCVNLFNPDERIDIGVGNPHDGFIRDGRMFFTTTNGHIVMADPVRRKVERVWNIAAMAGTRDLLGWCRGLEVVGDRAFVGFTSFRTTRAREFVTWVRHQARHLPTRIVCVDLSETYIADEWCFVPDDRWLIYSIHALD